MFVHRLTEKSETKWTAEERREMFAARKERLDIQQKSLFFPFFVVVVVVVSLFF